MQAFSSRVRGGGEGGHGACIRERTILPNQGEQVKLAVKACLVQAQTRVCFQVIGYSHLVDYEFVFMALEQHF